MALREDATVHCEATNRSQAAVQQRMEWLEEGEKSFLPPCFHSPVEKVENPFDLENLRFREEVYDERRKKEIFVTPELIQNFVARINELPDEGKPFVIGIGTGGTPSMDTSGPGGGLSAKLGFEGLLDHPKINSKIKREFDVLGLDLFKTDSSQLEIDDVGDMAISMSYIWENMRPELRARFNGFVVVHGTDTMSQSGAHLATMLGKGMPFNVVHTGAQRPINHNQSDFPVNFQDAFDTIKILHNSGLAECATVMGRKALLTIGTNKVSGEKLEAMVSPRHNHLVDFSQNFDVNRYRVRAQDRYRKKQGGFAFEPVVYRGPKRVAVLPAEMSEDPTSIRALIRHSAAQAILLAPYQSGTYDASNVKMIAEEVRRFDYNARAAETAGPGRQHDIPIFAVQQADEKIDLAKYAAAAEELKHAGVIALNMTTNAAIAKIMRALAICEATGIEFKSAIDQLVQEDFIGEISYRGMQYMDKFSPISTFEVEEVMANKVGSAYTADLSFGGDNAQNQITAMTEKGFRCDNLNNVVAVPKLFLLANTDFRRELLKAIDDFKREYAKHSPKTATTMYQELNTTFIPQVVAILNNQESTLSFMKNNNLEVTRENFIQLREEMLFVWSQLTGNNLVFTRNTPGGSAAEIYVPLAGPDKNGLIQWLDHGQRLAETESEFENTTPAL